jgi:hypothetical protein
VPERDWQLIFCLKAELLPNPGKMDSNLFEFRQFKKPLAIQTRLFLCSGANLLRGE